MPLLHRLRRLCLTPLLLAGLSATWSATALAGEVQVAVAANFAAPLARIGEGFTAATGHTLKITAGATGKFLTQIEAGAPFEVLLAADQDTPRRLVAEGRAVGDSQFTYAVGKLVLWSARPGVVDDQGAVLAGAGFAHLAVANPKLAPYGAAAWQVIKARGLAESLAPRIVTAESIAQAYQFTASGNADIGFVALSQVAGPGHPATGSMWVVPPVLYTPIRQDGVLLAGAASHPAAQALMAWLRSEPARQIIQSYGYTLP